MKDSEIIELFFRRSERSIDETRIKYGHYCKTIAYNILHSIEDTDECINDLYMKLWNSIPPAKPLNFKAYIGKITRNLALNVYEKTHAQKRYTSETPLVIEELAECLPDNESSNISDDIEIKLCINSFLKTLSAFECKVFIKRYWYMMTVNEIAEYLDTNTSKVKNTLSSLRKKFKTYLEKEGITL